MTYERLKIGLHGATVVIAALALLGGVAWWGIEKLVAAELAPLQQKVLTLEEANRRAAVAAEETRAGIGRLEAEIGGLKAEEAKQTEALNWIKDALGDLKAKAHSHTVTQ